MSSSRRSLVVVVCLSLPAVLALLPAGASGRDKKSGVRQPAPVPIAPTVGPAKPDDKIVNLTSFPTDSKYKDVLKYAQDYIHEQNWGPAAMGLQKALDRKDDVLVEVTRPEGSRWVSLWKEANRLLGSMPPNGRQYYELQFGARARTRLAEAKRSGDIGELAQVAQRYHHTEAGAEATRLLANYHLDRGNNVMAALCFELLLHHEVGDRLSPVTLYEAALAFRRAGDDANLKTVRDRLAKAAREGVTVAGQPVSLDQLRKQIDDAVPEDQPAGEYDWAMYRGNPARTGLGQGGAPFLEEKWSIPTVEDKKAREDYVEKALKYIEDNRSQPVLPGFFPIAVTVRTDKGAVPLLVYRSYGTVKALELRKEGKLRWQATNLDWSLEQMLADPDKRATLEQWKEQFLQYHSNLFLENTTVGTLTTDNSKVYFVDDLVLPPHPAWQPMQQLQWGGQMPSFGKLTPGVHRNSLFAVDLLTGKVAWETSASKDENDEFKDTFFLGPPLPVAGKLYVLTEKNQELHLLCLEPPKEGQRYPAVVWDQLLSQAQQKLFQDIERRTHACQLSYADGILVCPTNSGAVLGIDVLTHSLAWAHSYRDGMKTAKEANNMMGGRVMMIGGVMQMGGAGAGSHWRNTAPVIADGKVVIAPPDGDTVECLSLRDGSLVWRERQQGDDLFLGGVYNGKVLIVGRKSVRALRLADKKELWRRETGMPSGQGVASKNVYYLPLRQVGNSKEPAVCSIDVDRGTVAVIKSRKKEVPGNLLFYEGVVISQTANRLSAFPQLDVQLAHIDETLKQNPNDPTGLTERGELKLGKGNFAGAVDDLRAALTHQPPADLVPKTQSKLFEAFSELFQENFEQSAGKFLSEFRLSCTVAVPPEATPQEKQKLEEEQQHRLANYHWIMAKGREQQGKLLDAFQEYLDFAATSGTDELAPVPGESDVKARPDLCAQGRILAMIAKASAEQRRPLEDKIAAQWQEALKKNDTDTLRRFVAVFGALFNVGKEARMRLAERLMGENNFLEAEWQLNQLRRQADDPVLAARAVETLARLMIKKGLMDDAAHYYRLLGQDFADTVVRDGKTGADLFNDLATDKRFLPYLDEPPPPWVGKFKAREVTGVAQVQPSATMEPAGDPMPFFRRHRVAFDTNASQIKVIDKFTNESTFTATVPRNLLFQNLLANGYQNLHVTANHRGHLLVVNMGPKIYALDPVDHRRILWEKDLFTPGPNQQYMQPDPMGGWMVYDPNGFAHKIGQMGPVESNYVAMVTKDGLSVLDPLRGDVMWTKSDVSVRTNLFGDEQNLFVVEYTDAGASNSRALRARDGAVLNVPDFAALYQRRLAVSGRDLLVSDSEKGGVTLRLYDPLTGKDRWSKKFSANSQVLKSDDPDLTGVVEPDQNGKVTIIDLHTGKDVLVTRVDPKHLDKSAEVHLLADRDRYYLAIHKPDQQANPWGGPWASVNNGMKWILVNGMVYAFDRTTGKLAWRNEVLNQALVLEQFQDMPIMLFATRGHKPMGGAFRGGIQQYSKTLSFDKRTGKRLWDPKEMGNQHQQFYALQVNVRSGTVDLVTYNMKVEHYLEGADRGGPEVKENKTTAAPSQTGAMQGRVIFRRAIAAPAIPVPAK